MIAVGHFAIGAAAANTIMLVSPECVWKRRFRLTISAISGLWGMMPDVSKILPWDWIARFHDSWLADLCWGHRFVDTVVDPRDDRLLLVAGLIGWMLVSAGLVELKMWYEEGK